MARGVAKRRFLVNRESPNALAQRKLVKGVFMSYNVPLSAANNDPFAKQVMAAVESPRGQRVGVRLSDFTVCCAQRNDGKKDHFITSQREIRLGKIIQLEWDSAKAFSRWLVSVAYASKRDLLFRYCCAVWLMFTVNVLNRAGGKGSEVVP